VKTSVLKKIDGVFGPFLARMWPSLKPPDPLSSISRLLLIRPGGIGDAVLLIPVINRLREVFPAAYIEVLAEKRNCWAFALSPGVDRVRCYDRPHELWAILNSGYDVVIDSEQWHRLSAIIARWIRSRIKIGYGTNERKRLFTHSVGYCHDSYELNSFFELLKPLGTGPPARIDFPFLNISDEAESSADRLLGPQLGKPFIALFPGASIAERCWGVEKFSDLSRVLNDQGLSSVIVGGRQDIDTAEIIASKGGGINLAGVTSLSETAAVLSRSSLLVSGDSGVLHIAVGLDVPTVSLFGPGRALKWAPKGSNHIVLNKNLPCSPCTTFGYTPRCPDNARCIQDITVDEVFQAVMSLLEAQGNKTGEEAKAPLFDGYRI